MKQHESLESAPPFKRFILFYCEQYYPSGELGDAVATFDTLEEVGRWWIDPKNAAESCFDCDTRDYVTYKDALAAIGIPLCAHGSARWPSAGDGATRTG